MGTRQKSLLADAYGLWSYIADRPSVVLVVTCAALLFFGVGLIFGQCLSKKSGLEEKKERLRAINNGSGGQDSRANSASGSNNGSESDRANHGSPEAIQDTDHKRYNDGHGFSLKPLKLPNSDEVHAKQEGSQLGTDRSPNDSLQKHPSKTSWHLLNNDI